MRDYSESQRYTQHEEYKDEFGIGMPDSGSALQVYEDEGDELSWLDEQALLAAPSKVAQILARPDYSRLTRLQ